MDGRIKNSNEGTSNKMGRKLISLLLFGLLLSSCGQKVELEKELAGIIITKSQLFLYEFAAN